MFPRLTTLKPWFWPVNEGGPVALNPFTRPGFPTPLPCRSDPLSAPVCLASPCGKGGISWPSNPACMTGVCCAEGGCCLRAFSNACICTPASAHVSGSQKHTTDLVEPPVLEEARLFPKLAKDRQYLAPGVPHQFLGVPGIGDGFLFLCIQQPDMAERAAPRNRSARRSRTPGTYTDSPIRNILDEYPTQLEDPLPLVLRPHRRRLIIIHRGKHLRDTAKVAPYPIHQRHTHTAPIKRELTTRLPRRRGRPGHGPRRTPCRAAGCRTSSSSKSHALTIYARRLP